MDAIPEEKMRCAKDKDQPRRLFFPAAQTLDRRHAHEQEQAGRGGDVMGVKVRIKVGAKREGKKAKTNPNEPKLAHAAKKKRQGQINRNKKEKAVKARAVHEPLKIACNRLGALTMNGRLDFVVELLLHRQRTVGNRIRLYREGCRYTVLIPMELIWKRRPTARH